MNTKINFQKEYEKVVEQIKDGNPHSLLLHCCCAPCASHCLTVVTKDFDTSAFFYNPNIFPTEEYLYRLEELIRLTKSMPLPRPVRVIEGTYCPQDFFEVAKGLENAPERGERCYACFTLRLTETARAARTGGFEYFGTTLTLSPKKDEQVINAIGEKIASEYGVKWLPSDFKKQDGYLHSIALSKQYDLYRQNYCGCVYSKNHD